MIVVPFLTSHIKDLIVHDYMGHIQAEMNDAYAELLDGGPAYTALSDGKVIGCAGIMQTAKNRWEAWALLSNDSGKHMVGFTRAVNKFLNDNPKPRVETHVRDDFKIGHKWMKMLNFKCETPNGMPNYGDDGHDYYLYARCR